jgi:predicted Zn finger-like uncharacterized protein
MEVRCNQCSTRYEIPDEKVRGRRVRMPCRRCGNSILVDARAHTGPKPTLPDSPAPPPVAETPDSGADASGAGSGPEEIWSVSVDGTPRELTVREIAAQYRVGAIPRTAYVWRSGMKDWVFLPEARPLKSGLSRLGLDLDETMMSMAKLSDVAAAAGPTSSSPPPPREPAVQGAGETSEELPRREPEPSDPSLSRAQATVAAPVGSSPKPADLAADGPSIVVEDVEVGGPRSPGPAKMESAPVTVRRAPAISSKPTVRMKRPKLPPIKKKARFPVGTLVLVLVISAAAGLTGYWLSQRLGAEKGGGYEPEGRREPVASRVVAPAGVVVV